MQHHDGQRIYSRMLTNYGTEVPRCTRQKGAHSRQGEQRREAHAEHVSAREDVTALEEDDLAGDEEDGEGADPCEEGREGQAEDMRGKKMGHVQFTTTTTMTQKITMPGREASKSMY